MTLAVLLVGRGKVAAALRRSARGNTDLVCRARSLGQVRDGDLAWADAVLLAVPDAAIRAAAETLAPRVGRVPVLHLSGNRPVTEAAACAEHGALHPLASFASTERPPALAGAHFALAGTRGAERVGARVVRALGGRVLRASDGKDAALQGPAYHAAAALVANGAAALAASGVDILHRLGVARRPAQGAVAALLRTVAHNVEHVGVPTALTGPVMRGDADTVTAHRAALQALGGGSAEVYDAVALAILGCAVEAGLGDEGARGVQAALAGAPTGRRRTRSPRGSAAPRRRDR